MKRILATLLALATVLSCMMTVVAAEDQNTNAAVWDGSIDFTWMLNEPDATEYTLTTPAEFAGLAALVTGGNTFAGRTVKLGADIVLNSGNASDWATAAPANKWIPIGDNAHPFQGVFDGQGHTISGMYIGESPEAADTTNQYALFGVLSTTSADNLTPALRNFNLENSYVETMNLCKVAAIVGQIYTNQAADIKVENISVTGTTVVAGNNVAANVQPSGICSMVTINNTAATLTIQNVVCDVDLNEASTKRGNSATVGGIVGNFNKNTGTVIIQSCVVLGDISSEQMNAGGIVGMAAGAGTQIIRNCFIAGSITANTKSRGAGGVIGWQAKNSTFTVENCVVVSTLTSTNGTTDPIIALTQDATAVLTVPTGSVNYAITAEDGTYHKAIADDSLKGTNALTALGASFAEDWMAFENDYVMPIGAAVAGGKLELAMNRLAAVQETAVANGKIAVRLLGTVDSKTYKNVGFDIKIGTATEDKNVTTVFTKVAYGTGETAGSISATDYFTSYVYGVILTEVSASGTVTIEATPYVTAADGTKTASATTWVITYVDGVYVGTATK